MSVHLSWDLFIVVFFMVIVAYSLIIGRDNTLKVVLGTYVAALASDALGNLFGTYFGGSDLFIKMLHLLQLGTESEAIVFVKVLLFVAMVIMFAVKGSFSVETADDGSGLIKVLLSFLYAVMSAGLIVNVVLVFVSGVSFVGGGAMAGDVFAEMAKESALLGSMVRNSYVWFSLPAFAFLVHSLYTPKS